jgi:hypothetical protein
MDICIKVKTVGILLIMASTLHAAPAYEAVPWTKNFLEVRPVVSVEHHSITSRHKWLPHHSPKQLYQGTAFISAAPYPDWETDIGVTGNSLKDGKLASRVEYQVLSDLKRSPLALTVVGNVCVSAPSRARKPVFFEMASSAGELGIGLGRHFFLRKNAYTQLFSYVLTGIGTHQARWVTGEVGVQQVFYSKHFLRLALCCTHTYGHHSGSFQGFGTVRSIIKSVSVSYAYRFANGIEGRLSYSRKSFEKGCLRGAHAWQASLSLPLSF